MSTVCPTTVILLLLFLCLLFLTMCLMFVFDYGFINKIINDISGFAFISLKDRERERERETERERERDI